MKIILFILPFLSLIIVGCQFNTNNNQTNESTSTASTKAATKKFTDSPDFQNAYLISSSTLDQSVQKALTGFKLSKQNLANGVIQINLKANESGYKDQQYTLQPGQQLYFIDRTLGDDREKENNQADDYGIIVDSQGLIVSGN